MIKYKGFYIGNKVCGTYGVYDLNGFLLMLCKTVREAKEMIDNKEIKSYTKISIYR